MDLTRLTNKVKATIGRYNLLLKYLVLGPSALTPAQIKILVTAGMVKAHHIQLSLGDVYLQGHLSSLRGPSRVSVRDKAIKYLLSSAGQFIDKFADKQVAEIGAIVQNQLMAHTQQMRDTVKEEITEGVLRSKSSGAIVQAIKDKTQDYFKDWDRVVTTEITNAFNLGAVDAIIENHRDEKSHDEVMVYKQVVLDIKTCRWCKEFWLNADGSPKVYKLSELVANGSNMGLKQANWVPTIPATHPNCFTEKRLPVLTENGWKQIQHVVVGEKVLTHTGKYKRVTNTIKAPYHDKSIILISYLSMGDKFTVKVTPDHRFLTQRGWVEAQFLDMNDTLVQLLSPCVICGKTTHHRRCGDRNYNHFGPVSTCSNECFKKLMNKQARTYHDEMTDENKIIRAARISASLKTLHDEGIITSPFRAPGYWSPDRRKSASESIIRRMPEMLKASASTRISREQELIYGWLKDHFKDKNIILEYPLGRYTIDIAFVNEKIAVEIDGKYHALRGDTDKKRDAVLSDFGWTTLRFGVNGYSTKRTKIIELVQNVLNNHDDKFRFSPSQIISISKGKSGWHTNVYCLTVEGDESFIARGIVSHNCRCRLVELQENFGFKDGKLSYIGKDHNELKHQRKK